MNKWSWDQASVNLHYNQFGEARRSFHPTEIAHVTRPSEGDPADGAALGDGFCSATFDAPERPGKSLDPPKPYWGQIWAVQVCAGSTPSHPIASHPPASPAHRTRRCCHGACKCNRATALWLTAASRALRNNQYSHKNAP